MFQLLRIPIIVSVVAIVASYFVWGPAAAITVAILSALEVTFSFDNAIVNAKILARMSERWQRLFLTVGVLIAVFGMRLLFPLIVVALAGHLSPIAALQLAVQHPGTYAHHLHDAHPAIAAFGGTFLMMLFLDWLFEERAVRWLKPLELALFKVGRVENVAVIIMSVLLVVAATVFGHATAVLTAGVLGLATYLAVSSLDALFDEDKVATVAKAGLGTFLYLEVLDSSFSFDGVVGAFAVTSNIFLIAIGLGVGAMFVRGMTVYLVRKGTLAEFIYLEHGAHWAIGVLAGLLLASIRFELPDVVTGMTGVVIIAAALTQSIVARKQKTLARSAS